MEQTKIEIRGKYINIRNNFSKKYINNISKSISNKLFNLKEYKDSKNIFIYLSLDDEINTSYIINKAKQEGRRVIAVGTTSCRVLESIADENTGMVKPIEDDTEIFIYPGYKFKCIDGLITNFHLPQSTLLMLVSALAGKEYIMKAYKEAVKEKYRFFSFGDAMFII